MNPPRPAPAPTSPTGPSPIRLGALVPLSRPGWTEAGHHLLAGLELAARDVGDAGGVAGRPVELVVRDTAGDPGRAVEAVDELVHLGVAAVAGEYHSVAARAAAMRADVLGIPFLCSSAVLDSLVNGQTPWIARLAPMQSLGWRTYAQFLVDSGHPRIAVAVSPSVYWEAGRRILADHLLGRGGTVVDLDVRLPDPAGVCDGLADSGATALLLLVGHPDPAVSIVRAVRRDPRLDGVLIGAPAGQPEFASWASSLGDDGAGIPFLRYLPDRLEPLGERVRSALRDRLGEAPSFVAFEGYDTVLVLAEILRALGTGGTWTAESWRRVDVAGTRGIIRFSLTPGGPWHWPLAPIQVVDRDPSAPDRFRVLHSRSAGAP